MSDISVTVRNRLGATYGTRQINVNEDDDTESHSVSFGNHVQLMLPGDNTLHSIEIEAQSPEIEDFSGNGIPIPITIDSPQNYTISTLNHEAENIWRIGFETLESSSKLEVEAAPEPPPVNVTVGHDEPDGSVESRTAGILIAGSLFTAITLLLSEVSTYLGIAVPPTLGLGAAIVWLIDRLRSQN